VTEERDKMDHIQAESQASRLIDDDRQLIQRSSEALVMKLSGTVESK